MIKALDADLQKEKQFKIPLMNNYIVVNDNSRQMFFYLSYEKSYSLCSLLIFHHQPK